MNANIRIGHFSTDAPNVNVLVDGETVLENVSFGTISDFLSIAAGSIDVAVVPAAGGDAVIEASLDLRENLSYTVLAINTLENIEALVLTDEFDAIADDEASVRVVHTSPDAPAVDVAVPSGPTLFESVEFGEVTEFAAVDAGAYDIDVLPSGSDDAVISLSDLSLDGGRFYTAIATGTVADDSLDVTLLADVPESVTGRKAARR